MNVLSLFDGMSCGQLALQRAGIKVDNYFASEVDIHAMSVTRYNFPNTHFLGDVSEVDVSTLPHIDLLIGGSPCQGFSFAGKLKGASTRCKKEIITLDQYLELKEQNFEFEGQSYLFWEYVRIYRELKQVNPNIKFLLENVKMTKKWESVLTLAIGVTPVLINSSLVSAQLRLRLYWSNLEIKTPEDKMILLQSILMDGYADKNKAFCIDANYYKGGNYQSYFGKSRRHLVFSDKNSFEELKALYESEDGIKSLKHEKTRKLNPIECERLQTVPDDYTKFGVLANGGCKQVSNTQRYKMLGNSWTVDVIAHILKGLK